MSPSLCPLCGFVGGAHEADCSSPDPLPASVSASGLGQERAISVPTNEGRCRPVADQVTELLSRLPSTTPVTPGSPGSGVRDARP